MAQPPGGAALADGVDALLRCLQDLGGGARFGPHQLPQLPGGLPHPAQQGLVRHDVHVLQHVGGGGGDLHELAQVGHGVVVIGPRLLHPVHHRHRVDGLEAVEHGEHHVEQGAVLAQVKIVGPQPLHDGGDAPLVNEHGAQHRLLRHDGVGHLQFHQFLGGHGPASLR